jgi:hypothetical protein
MSASGLKLHQSWFQCTTTTLAVVLAAWQRFPPISLHAVESRSNLQVHLFSSIAVLLPAFMHAYGHCWHAAAFIASPAGEPLYAWCGPQPNSRLLLNYGIVDESNPYDKLPLTVTLPANDPLYKVKRGILQVGACAYAEAWGFAAGAMHKAAQH